MPLSAEYENSECDGRLYGLDGMNLGPLDNRYKRTGPVTKKTSWVHALLFENYNVNMRFGSRRLQLLALITMALDWRYRKQRPDRRELHSATEN